MKVQVRNSEILNQGNEIGEGKTNQGEIYEEDSIIMEKEMATHSSILSWEIPWTEEPGGLQSAGSQKIWT